MKKVARYGDLAFVAAGIAATPALVRQFDRIAKNVALRAEMLRVIGYSRSC